MWHRSTMASYDCGKYVLLPFTLFVCVENLYSLALQIKQSLLHFGFFNRLAFFIFSDTSFSAIVG